MLYTTTLLLALATTHALAQAPCFHLGNDTAMPNKYVKCGNSNMCCRTNDQVRPDSCAQDKSLVGLCISHDQDIWRESCTDQAWGEAGCLNLCMDVYDDKENNRRINRTLIDYQLTRCVEDGSLCCGAPGSTEAGDCCKARRGVYLDNLKVLSSRPSTPSPTSPSTSSSTPTSSPPASLPNSPARLEQVSNTAVIVGGVVGGIVGLAVVAAAVWLFLRREKRKGMSGEYVHEKPGATYLPAVSAPPSQHAYRAEPQVYAELPYEGRKQGELAGSKVKPVEM